MGAPLSVTELQTPLGPLTAAADEDGLYLLCFSDSASLPEDLERLGHNGGRALRAGSSPWFGPLEAELGEYFALKRRAFGIPLVYSGSPFQRAVWRELEAIPYGGTMSYSAQAAAIGRPSAVRAVARADGRNRIGILLPCHRVIGANGSLSGYAWGLERKKRLLELEAQGLRSASRPSS